MNPLEEIAAICPWCGSEITIVVDVSAGAQSYVEDCQICCAPMVVTMELDAEGDLRVELTREGG